MKTKVGVVSLGCDKNRVDTEVMLAKLRDGGYEITADPSQSDVIIINTCAFLEASRKEAIETALEMANYKESGNCKKIILTGCLGQRFGQEVFDALTEVDAVVGAFEYDDICQIVHNTLQDKRQLYCCEDHINKITHGNRVLTTDNHTAYLKIGDGCNNFCTYCLIPYIRGRFRSIPMETLVEEAQTLVNTGVKELILVAQDTTKYGVDLYGESKIVELVQKLSSIDGLVWIRLLYCYPELMTDALIDEIATNPKVVKYVDIPLQHINDTILKKMNRRSDTASIIALFDKLHQRNIQVRSTFICGFPGETQQTVDQIDEFLNKYKLRNVGFFAYSREEGTAAAKFDNQVHPRTKQKYVKQLYRTQYAVAHENNLADIGKTYLCLIDQLQDFDGEFYTYRARTEFMSPEIDGVVYATSDKQLEVGQFVNVKIVDVYEYDLAGEVLL